MTGPLWLTLFVALLLISVLFRLPLLLLADILLVLVAGAAHLWRRYSLAGVEYRRRFGETHLTWGEEADVTVEMVNRKVLPLPWLRVEDEFPLPVELLSGTLSSSLQPQRATLVNLVTLRWYERVRRRYRIRGQRRGRFEFGPARLSSGDLFGFAQQDRHTDDVDVLFVYPKVIPISRLGFPARRPFGDDKAPRRVFEDPVRFMTVREYAPGDPFRTIHWKATARTQRLQTRVHEPTTTQRLVIFLDVQTVERNQHVAVPEYLELAVTAAASIACYALDAGFQVGLCTNTTLRFSQPVARVPASRDPAQLTRLLETLAQVSAVSVRPIEHIVESEARQLPYGATVVAISALPTPGLQTALVDLRAAGHAVSLVTVGDDWPRPAIPGVRVYPIGGRQEWLTLENLDLA